jgi:hypothetical protein
MKNFIKISQNLSRIKKNNFFKNIKYFEIKTIKYGNGEYKGNIENEKMNGFC